MMKTNVSVYCIKDGPLISWCGISHCRIGCAGTANLMTRDLKGERVKQVSIKANLSISFLFYYSLISMQKASMTVMYALN